MEQLLACPLCNNTELKPYGISADDFQTRSGSYSMCVCEGCGLIFTNPRPKEEDVWKFYQSSAYISHTRVGQSLKDRLYFAAQRYMLQKKFRLIQSLGLPSLRLLDYGCGAGAFLHHLYQKGIDVVGFEPNTNAASLARSKGAPVYGTLTELEQNQPRVFDVITLWHVLEHSYSPQETINYIHNRLRPGGWAVIALPMADSFDSSFYKGNWAAYDLPRHLLHFKPSTLIRAFQEQGFQMVQSQGMPLDAFYIAWLSESHMGTFAGFLRAFMVAALSNAYALVGTKSWSSQIFIFQKIH